MQTEKERVVAGLTGWQFVRSTHGSLYDRGGADSYYHRGPDPHYGGIGGCPHPKVTELSEDEIREYMQGYQDNEDSGSKKEW